MFLEGLLLTASNDIVIKELTMIRASRTDGKKYVIVDIG